ncbi:MAG TPA: hypothetical protein VKZ79_18685 [Alphaproteobacteria bacterium]|nr:hypothetical protein [Alphaproteobacteria bacterium]
MSPSLSRWMRAVTGMAAAALLLGTTAPALADHDHDRDHDRGRHAREWRDRDWDHRYRDWHDRGRVYYGDQVYVDPPPAVVYGPPPPPPGLNLMFSFGR